DRLAGAAGLEPEDELPRILRRLDAYLPERDGRYAVYHKSFADWLTAPDQRGSLYYVSPRKGHERLAALLVRELPAPLGGGGPWGTAPRSPSRYGLLHLPSHLAEAGRWDDLTAFLCDLPFLEGKAEAGLVFGLVADFAAALERLPADHPRRPVLRLLEEAMLTDVYFLARHPTTLFQCLWNRGWWYGCPEPAP